MNLVSFSKPYVSPVDDKVKFDPMISIASGKLTCDSAINLSGEILTAVRKVHLIKDYMEKYKDDEQQLQRLVDDFDEMI